MSISLLPLTILSQTSGIAEPANPASNRCVVSGYAESSFEDLRPFPNVACNYDVAEFHKRLLSLFRWPKQGLGIETVERAFSLPHLKTAFDHPRSASFTAFVSGAPGEKSWRASISYHESFFPTDAWRRPRFRGAERPVLINPSIRGERRVNIVLHPAKDNSSDSADCLDIAAVRGTAIHQGWSESKFRIPNMPLHGGPITLPPVQFYRGRWSIDVQLDRTDKCVTEIGYRSEADKGAN
ncbi:MAG: hypothetical protein Q8R81_08035 [Novosphingobium sp.]|uniref:hypothetical protein n=1 Tax=Novosphingobium sp. TaxID=1874826 RepID=UPI0027354755|nr:hypothetical protein [Novosphingobium sp.]MDP3550331.1 hypothetical protein [Novosphingobium sp.]